MKDIINDFINSNTGLDQRWDSEKVYLPYGRYKKYNKITYNCETHGDKKDSYYTGLGKCLPCEVIKGNKTKEELREYEKLVESK